MKRIPVSAAPARRAFSKVSAALLIACATLGTAAAAGSQSLTGDQEVPPVMTKAAGTGDIAISSDGAVTGAVKTTGMEGIMAHIHQAAPGVNGPVIIPLTKTADGVWSVPAGAKLTPEQMQAFKDGNLYVNVHTAEHKSGEIRAQLKP